MTTTPTPSPQIPSEQIPSEQVLPRRELNWHDPSLTDLDKRPWAKTFVVTAMLIFGALVDAGLMKPAIERVLRDTSTMSGIIAVALACVGAAAAATAGTGWRGARGNNPGHPGALVMPILTLLAWAALGGGIAALRLGAASINATTQYDTQATSSSGPATPDIIAAVLFLIVFLLVGALAFAEAFQWRNDAWTAKANAQKKLEPARRTLADAEALLVRMTEDLDIRKHELATNPQEGDNAKQANAAFAQELEQVSRVLQMIGLGDASKSGITSAQHPDNPYPART